MTKQEFENLLGNFLMEFSGMEEDNFLEAMPDIQESIERLTKAYDELLESSDKERIQVIISGGAVQDVTFPESLKGVELEIRDYDNNDLDDPHVLLDENNDPYQQMLFDCEK